jgi:ACT domain-containing protein
MSKYLDQEGVKTLWELVKDRNIKRDNHYNYKDNFVPYNGQICFVDTAKDGLQFKVGDGVTTWSKLSYIQASETVAGLTKLYSTTGENTDGAMTQKATSEILAEKISMEVDDANELVHFYK